MKPLEQWSILFTGDYLRSQGTGSRGVDFFQAAMAGINFADVNDPRKVNLVGFDPTQDTRHWGMSKMHGQRHLLTEVLKDRMGFDGIVISDWDGVDEVQGCAKDRCAQAINAGIDMIMVPDQWKAFLQNTVSQVEAGDIPMARIDDAVIRILRVKLRAGLFEKGRPSSRPLANQVAQIGAPEHRAVARDVIEVDSDRGARGCRASGGVDRKCPRRIRIPRREPAAVRVFGRCDVC